MSVEHDYARVFREPGPPLWRALYAFTGGPTSGRRGGNGGGIRPGDEHRGIRDPAAWIFRTAFRIARAELERERRRPEERIETSPEEPTPDLRALVDALRHLPPNQRAVVVLRYEADLPIAEIARRLGLASPTVRVHLHRARVRLRELLTAEENEHV